MSSVVCQRVVANASHVHGPNSLHQLPSLEHAPQTHSQKKICIKAFVSLQQWTSEVPRRFNEIIIDIWMVDRGLGVPGKPIRVVLPSPFLHLNAMVTGFHDQYFLNISLPGVVLQSGEIHRLLYWRTTGKVFMYTGLNWKTITESVRWNSCQVSNCNVVSSSSNLNSFTRICLLTSCRSADCHVIWVQKGLYQSQGRICSCLIE